MTAETTTLPARILVQVREGVPNLLADFDLPVHATKPLDPSDPSTIAGAKVAHKIDSRDLIAGLAEAQRKLVENMVEAHGPVDAEDAAWLRGLFEWVMSA